ncbi:MAG: leucine-rich repeat protein [Lachnospiraceae bacterium]|nr:leucine-rich repeat protein [Lachnospiraceae bacterium]
MKKRFLRAVAGVMTLLLLTTCMNGALAVYAGEDKATATKQEKVLTVTQDMVGKNGVLTITGEWDKIVIPKEIDASRIKFKKVTAGIVEIESGNKSNIEIASGEVGEVAVVPAKLEEMTVQELAELIRLTEDSGAAVEKYRAQKEQNDAYLNARPTVVTGKDAAVGTVTISGNVKLDCKNGTVSNLKVEADGSQKELNVNISNYEGDVDVKQTERKDGDWMIARVKMKNSKVENLNMEGKGRGNIVLSGQDSEVKDVNVESAPTLSLNLPSESLNIAETATNASVNILAKVENILISASEVKMEVGSCGSVVNAKIDGNNVTISGNGTLAKVDIIGDGAYVSTLGTNVTGKNNYVKPVVGGLRDLGGLHVVIGDWYSTGTPVPSTEEEIALDQYRKDMMERYNFTVEQKYIANWNDFQDVFRTSVALGTPAANIFMMDQRFLEGNRDYFYDLSTLYELDFDNAKWDEDIKELMTWKDGIYGMSTADKEARGGVFINMDLYTQAMEAADLSMEDYDPFVLQEKGEWTWSKFEEICGILDEQLNENWNGNKNDKIYALTSQDTMTLSQLVYSTGTEFVGYDPVKGEYVNNLSNPNVEKAYNYAIGLFEKGYDIDELENPSGAESLWNWFAKRFFDEKAVMQFGEAYYMTVGTSGDYTSTIKYNDMDANIAFLCCPKPDEGDGSDSYHTYFSDNVAVMPACYDAKTAADIAFAYNIWTNPAPGYEEESADEWKSRYVDYDWDERSTDETLSIFYNEDIAVNQYINFMEDLEKFTMEDEYFEIDGTLFYRWKFHRNEEGKFDLGYLLDDIMPYWDETIEAANNKRKLYMPTARPDATFNYEASPYKVEVNPDGTIRLKKHKNPAAQGSEIVIPSELFGRKVVEIAPNAFRGRNITSVVIPEGITTISPFAFGYCENLGTVTTPYSLTTIGDNAFFRCTHLQSINLTENVTSIGNNAFSENEVEFHMNLTITTVEGSYADRYAKDNLIPVVYDGQISEFTYEKVLITPENGESYYEIWITGYESLADRVVIADRYEGSIVAVVSGGAFKGCTDIKSVSLPAGLCAIEEEAFAGCTGLTEVTVPTWVWAIQANAFAGCTGLTTVTLPENVSWIGSRAFAGCTNLTEIYIPANASGRNWETDIFEGCDTTKLTVVTDDSDMAYFASELGFAVREP